MGAADGLDGERKRKGGGMSLRTRTRLRRRKKRDIERDVWERRTLELMRRRRLGR